MISQVEKDKLGISEKLVRISVGVEYYEDLIFDIERALSVV